MIYWILLWSCWYLNPDFSVVWLDLRTQSTVESLINKAPGRDKNHLKVWSTEEQRCVCVCVWERVCPTHTLLFPQPKTGLPISTYFSAVKLRWLLDNVGDVRQAVRSGRAMFGTVDSWIIWVGLTQRGEFICDLGRLFGVPLEEVQPLFPQCLTGGSSGGVHCTDVTNASRTMLFNIHTMDWDSELCRSATLTSCLKPFTNHVVATDQTVAPNTTTFRFSALLLSSPFVTLSSDTLMSQWKSFPASEAPPKSTVTWWVEPTAADEPAVVNQLSLWGSAESEKVNKRFHMQAAAGSLPC